MINDISVTKRNGKKEKINLDKIHQVLEWACADLDKVSISQIELKSHIQFYDGITTKDIHETLTKTAADLISVDVPDYQYVAARLAMFQLRKIAYSQYEPPNLFDHITNMVTSGKYDGHILDDYTEDEINELDKHIDHDRDLNFAYAGIKQLEGKYLVQDRTTGEIFESPQMVYMLIGMCLFSKYDKNTRLDYVKRFYNDTSLFKISLPTPIMGGVRTPTRQFSSCVLIDTDDSLDSINASASSIVKYISRRAGIGLNVGKIRALGSSIRGGEIFHTGIIPFLKHFQTAVKSCSQGGQRGGAATLFYPIWHLEVESLLVLKNNKGVEENRIRHLDYGVQLNKLFYTRFIKKQDITLFSPSDVPSLYESFYSDQHKFEELYVKYEQDDTIRKKVIPATELFSTLMQERANTGRIYIMNVDHANNHSPFITEHAPIKMSNLCCLTGDTIIDVIDENDNKCKLTLKDVVESVIPYKVKSYNINTKTIEYKDILNGLLTRKDSELLKITDIESGKEIYCTDDHRIYTTNRGYVMAKDLTNNDDIIVNGTSSKCTTEPVDFKADVYDIEVDENHNFFANDILVHNCEILLPTKTLDNVFDDKGEVALCTLSAINLGKIDSLSEIIDLTEMSVRALDALLDYQHYPLKAAEKTLLRRNLGVGVINYAHYLAKNNMSYSGNNAYKLTHEIFETFQYGLIKASVQLAKEFGKCEYFDETTYSKGILPIDTYKKDVDNIVDVEYLYDWGELRKDIIKYGMRNSTLSAIAPTETSSQVSNATNGIEPPRGLITVKSSKDGIFKQVVPDIENLKDKYELLWNIPDNNGYLKLVAIMQKFIDQSISTNTNYDPEKFNDGKVPMATIIQDLLTAYKLGIKTLYYHNTRDGANDVQDDDCVSCKI